MERKGLSFWEFHFLILSNQSFTFPLRTENLVFIFIKITSNLFLITFFCQTYGSGCSEAYIRKLYNYSLVLEAGRLQTLGVFALSLLSSLSSIVPCMDIASRGSMGQMDTSYDLEQMQNHRTIQLVKDLKEHQQPPKLNYMQSCREL